MLRVTWLHCWVCDRKFDWPESESHKHTPEEYRAYIKGLIFRDLGVTTA